MDAAATALVQRCRSLVEGRRVVIVGGVVAGATRRAAQLREFGATEVLVVAEGLGTGALPDPAAAAWVVVEPEVHPTRVSDEVAAWARFAADPPAAARQAVQSFDPERTAVCLLNPFATTSYYLGREVLGGRSPGAQAWEDKTLCDQLWDEAGVPRAESRVVPLDDRELALAAAQLDRGAGTVWSGDAAAGVNGGADAVRWVRTQADATAALAALRPVSGSVRVMPFLDGVPCSIHGFVVDDGVAAFRPVELVVLRSIADGGETRLVPAGISSTWEPPEADRAHMRDAARRIGELLARRIAYRGGFSVDGVLTADGWLPTELNPRFSGGLNTIAHGLPDLPLELLQGAAVRGVDVGASAPVLERLLLTAADASPFGAMHVPVPGRVVTETVSVAVTGGPDRMTPRSGSEPVTGTLELGPAALGGLVRFVPTEHRPGTRFADLSLAALALADELWGTGFGALTAPPDVRT